MAFNTVYYLKLWMIDGVIATLNQVVRQKKSVSDGRQIRLNSAYN